MLLDNSLLTMAVGLGGSSLIGSVLGMFIKKIPHRWNDIFLGFCAGMMLAASIMCLLLPAIEMIELKECWQVLLGVASGVLLICLLDNITPHLHRLTGTDIESHKVTSLNRVLLFVLAIAIHKLPEGLATGIVFDAENLQNSYTVAITIALQNIPEGLVVVTPLIMLGIKMWRVAIVSLVVALLEVIGVVLGFALADISTILLPYLTALAGGAMLYVISDEMIPETHAHGYEKHATFALVIGVVMMLFVQKFV
jgi:ZIP family zinc transporter